MIFKGLDVLGFSMFLVIFESLDSSRKVGEDRISHRRSQPTGQHTSAEKAKEYFEEVSHISEEAPRSS